MTVGYLFMTSGYSNLMIALSLGYILEKNVSETIMISTVQPL